MGGAILHNISNHTHPDVSSSTFSFFRPVICVSFPVIGSMALYIKILIFLSTFVCLCQSTGKFCKHHVTVMLLILMFYIGFQHVTCKSVLKLVHTQSNIRLHSHDVKYGSGSGQQVTTPFYDLIVFNFL